MNRATSPHDVSAIIVSLNSKSFTRGCLRSISSAALRDVSLQIVVVDNGSTDGTQEMLRTEWPEVTLIENKKNIGFCAAGNQGAREAKGRYLLFLNDDILILDDAIPRLVEFMDSHPRAGMIGSRLLNADGTDQLSSGRTFPTPMNALFGRKSWLTRVFPWAPWARAYLLSDRLDSASPYRVDWLSAAAMMVRREVFDAVGGLVESFYYFHELVFCDRVQRAGHEIFLDPKSKILHYEGAGSGVRSRRIRRKHILAFHWAAYRWYCLHKRMGAYNPIRIVVAMVLCSRAAALVVLDSLKPSTRLEKHQAEEGRPEGGLAL